MVVLLHIIFTLRACARGNKAIISVIVVIVVVHVDIEIQIPEQLVRATYLSNWLQYAENRVAWITSIINSAFSLAIIASSLLG